MKIFLSISLFLFSNILVAQKFISKTSIVTFFSDAAIEDIAATNEKSTSIFDLESGEIAFLITITNFEFEKSLMQEHFNEKYMESDKFPKAIFKGTIIGYSKGTVGLQSVHAKGVLSIHGQSKEINIPGSLQLQDDTIIMRSDFMIDLKDYRIKIPKLLWQNIAEIVEVKIEFTYKPL